MKRDSRFFASGGIIALILFMISGMSFHGIAQMPGPVRTLSQSDWNTLLASGHHVGPKSAPVTIVEFSDFLCTHCKEFNEALDLYRKDNPGQIQIVYHNFPLPQHAYSKKLAASAECVAKMGNYERYYSLLYKNQDGITKLSLDSLAVKAGVKDVKAFNGCLSNQNVLNTIQHDVDLGEKIGLMQTPTIVINRVLYSGALTYQQLSEAIDFVTHNK